jgi:hypothetical protein
MRLPRSIREAEERDRRFIGQLDLRLLNDFLWPLYVGFLCLNFMDLYSTLVAMKVADVFREMNPIASALFSHQFEGFLLAVAFKYLPAIPLFYVVFAKDASSRHPLEIRVVKFIGLVTLISADMILFYIVAINNFPQLLKLSA